MCISFCQTEVGKRDYCLSRGLGDEYNRQVLLPSSLMVAVPEAAPLLVTVPVIVPVVNVKLSLVSNTLSLVIAVRSTTLVLFAPMLTPLTADTHELPS